MNIDVLAVLDEAQDWLYRSSESKSDDARAEAVKQASAAVAELIEAAREWCALMPGLAGGPEFDRLQAAAYNIGPQS